MDERVEAAIGLVVVHKQPLLLGLEECSEWYKVRMAQSANGIHVLLERLCFQCRWANLGGVEPLDNHDEAAVEHSLVRRPHAPAPEHLCRSAHELLEAVARRLAGAECQAPAPLQAPCLLLRHHNGRRLLIGHALDVAHVSIVPAHLGRGRALLGDGARVRRGARAPPLVAPLHGNHGADKKRGEDRPRSDRDSNRGPPPPHSLGIWRGRIRHAQVLSLRPAVASGSALHRGGGGAVGSIASVEEEEVRAAALAADHLAAELGVARERGGAELRDDGRDRHGAREVVVGDVEHLERRLVPGRECAAEVVGVEAEEREVREGGLDARRERAGEPVPGEVDGAEAAQGGERGREGTREAVPREEERLEVGKRGEVRDGPVERVGLEAEHAELGETRERALRERPVEPRGLEHEADDLAGGRAGDPGAGAGGGRGVGDAQAGGRVGLGEERRECRGRGRDRRRLRR